MDQWTQEMAETSNEGPLEEVGYMKVSLDGKGH